MVIALKDALCDSCFVVSRQEHQGAIALLPRNSDVVFSEAKDILLCSRDLLRERQEKENRRSLTCCHRFRRGLSHKTEGLA